MLNVQPELSFLPREPHLNAFDWFPERIWIQVRPFWHQAPYHCLPHGAKLTNNNNYTTNVAISHCVDFPSHVSSAARPGGVVPHGIQEHVQEQRRKIRKGSKKLSYSHWKIFFLFGVYSIDSRIRILEWMWSLVRKGTWILLPIHFHYHYRYDDVLLS